MKAGPRTARPGAKPRLFGIGHAAIEPTLGLNARGDIFLTAFESSLRIDVLRSVDGGRSWNTVSPSLGGQNAHLVSADPYLYVDPRTDRVFTVDLTVACSFLSYSDDAGGSWTTNPLACGRPVNDHQTLFSGRPLTSTTVGYPRIIYYCFSDLVNSVCSKSLDGGLSFTPTGEPAFPAGVYPDGGPCPGWHGHGVSAPDGTIYLPKAHCGRPWLAISNDEGLTWGRVQVSSKGTPRGGSDPAVAVDRAGNVFYLWISNDRLPYLAVSRDEGLTWSKPLMVGGPGVTEANLPTIAAGRKGALAIAYVGSENSLFQQCGNGRPCDHVKPTTPTWNGYITVTSRALDRRPLLYTARVNTFDDPLVRGNCGPGRCSYLLDFIDIQIDPSGQPWA
ncbi:MAG: sialidase family protein, partial [Actinomycetota bacterium]